jgi:hypothetical protein
MFAKFTVLGGPSAQVPAGTEPSPERVARVRAVVIGPQHVLAAGPRVEEERQILCLRELSRAAEGDVPREDQVQSPSAMKPYAASNSLPAA